MPTEMRLKHWRAVKGIFGTTDKNNLRGGKMQLQTTELMVWILCGGREWGRREGNTCLRIQAKKY